MSIIQPIVDLKKKDTQEDLELFKFGITNNDKFTVAVYGWNKNAHTLQKKIGMFQVNSCDTIKYNFSKKNLINFFFIFLKILRIKNLMCMKPYNDNFGDADYELKFTQFSKILDYDTKFSESASESVTEVDKLIDLKNLKGNVCKSKTKTI